MKIKKRHIDKLLEIVNEKETWSTIPGYENYWVSDQGRVYSFNKNDLITPEKTENGYLRVVLRDEEGNKKKARLHRLVAEAFIPNPDNLPQVDHKSGVKLDNRVSNLRWITNQDNQIAAVQKGGRKTKTNKDAQRRLAKRIEKFIASQGSLNQ